MTRTIIVLVTSIAKKIPMLQAVKKSLANFPASRLIGADIDPHCLGRYFVDDFWEMPPIGSISREEIAAFCKEKKVNAIIPTRNEELLFWAEHCEFLRSKGIEVMISSVEALLNCIDKYHFYRFLKAHQHAVPPTFLELGNFDFAEYVVKERMGAGARKIGIGLNLEEALQHAKSLVAPLFQPYIPGDEYSVDLYLDKEHKVKGAIARKRDLVVSGESQITTTIKDPVLEKICTQIAEELKLRGHVLFQVIKHHETRSNFIIECNPRFGGASTLSIAAGLDSFTWFFHELLKEEIPPFKRSPKELRLVRHAEDTIVSF